MEYPDLTGDEFKNIINLFKWVATVTISGVTIIVSVAMFVSYKDINSLRNELNEKSVKMYEEVKDLRKYSQDEIVKTQEYSLKQIAQIKDDAKSYAIIAAKSEIAATFERENIKSLVEETAEKKLYGQLNNLLDKQMVKNEAILQSHVEILPKIMTAIDKIRFGSIESLIFIDSLSKYSNRQNIRELCKDIYMTKVEDYRKTFKPYVKETISEYENAPSDDIVPLGQEEPLLNVLTVKMLRSKDKVSIMKAAIATVRRSKNLNDIAIGFLILEYYTGLDIKLFDFEDFEKFVREQKLNK
jgi:hypothetical protein